MSEGVASSFVPLALVLLLIRAEPRHVAATGTFDEEGVEVCHECEFGLGAFFPTKVER